MNLWNTRTLVVTILTVVVYLIDFGDGKGGGGGGGRGGGGFGGGRGIRSGGRGLLGGKKGALLVPAAAAGVGAGYVYGSVGLGHRFHSNPNSNPAFRSGGGAVGFDQNDVDYKAQESTYYGRKEGLGMSAWGLLALILGIIAAGTMAWYCYMLGVPLWKDRQRRNRNRMEGHPLQETPSTATPSP